MKKTAQFCGGLGIIFLIFGVMAALSLPGQLRTIGLIQMVLGFFGIVLFVFHFFNEMLKAVSRKRDAIFGVLGGIFILFILIAANVVANSRFGERKFDTTVNKVHSLSDDSIKLTRSLSADIEVYAFLQDGSRERDLLRDLIQKYQYETQKIKLKIMDPDSEPTLMKEMDAHSGEILVRNEASKKTLKLTNLAEQDFTMTLKRVMSTQERKIYFIQGHDEGDLEDDKGDRGLSIAKLLLENEGFKVEGLALAEKQEIPKDAFAVAAWGAQRSYSKGEVDLLTGYLDRGGNLVIAQDPLVSPKRDQLTASGLEPLIEKYGLTFKPSILLERQILPMQGQVINPQIQVTTFGKHPITEKLTGRSMVEMAFTQVVDQKADYKGSAKREVLASSSRNSWAETDMTSLFLAKQPKVEGDAKGPLPVAQIAEAPVAEGVKDSLSKESRLIVFGDSDFAQNGSVQGGFNRDLLANSFSYLTGEEAALSIRPKSLSKSTLEISPQARAAVYFSGIFLIPELIMMLGVVIWILRRNRSQA